MNWLGQIIGSGAGEFIKGIAGCVDKFVLTGEEKQKFQLELAKITHEYYAQLEQTIAQELSSKEKVLVAELTQGDEYTKRARPTVVYFGLAVVAFNYCLVPLVSQLYDLKFTPLDLPQYFWYGWAGIVSTWSIGRTAEKMGAFHGMVQTITGVDNKKSTNLLGL